MLLEAELPAVHPTLRMPRNPRGYARRLYAALHELDDAGCAVVFVEKPPNDERWMAITDRLRRAATPA
jgi:L-threonylcarbamoyladenylate synthase